MTAVIFEGIAWGLLLSVLTGPIFFTILQVSMERGFRAGLTLVSGQWLSDFIYIGMVVSSAAYMQFLEKDQEFRSTLSLYLGTTGAIFLSILGMVLLLTKNKTTKDGNLSKSKSYLAFFLQGFFINTLTPFPVFFWISLMSSAIGRNMERIETILLLFIVMLMVIITDLIKVYTAKRISNYVNAKYTAILRRIAGLALILSGLIMFIRIFFLNT